MSSSAGLSIRQLTRYDQALMKAPLVTFGDAFDQAEAYGGNQPVLHFDIAIEELRKPM